MVVLRTSFVSAVDRLIYHRSTSLSSTFVSYLQSKSSLKELPDWNRSSYISLVPFQRRCGVDRKSYNSFSLGQSRSNQHISHENDAGRRGSYTKKRKKKAPSNSNHKRKHSTYSRTNIRTSSNHHTRRSTSSSVAPLPDPTVLYSNNHLIVVNKPAGYHSQPNESMETANQRKCLLSNLKRIGLGGGSTKSFLLPMHRLDQPCTGALMLAKNSKAGTRIGNAFRKHLVQKDYLCVVEGDLQRMIQASKVVDRSGGGSEREVYRADAMTQKLSNTHAPVSRGRGKSVKFVPLRSNQNLDKSKSSTGNGRVCSIEWEHVMVVPEGNRKQVRRDMNSSQAMNNKGRHLIRVKTSTGAKHQVRAMLSQILNSPICGDLRYGAEHPLPDQSVALHARTLYIPTVQLANTDTRFVAPIPPTWSEYFKLHEKDLSHTILSNDH